MFNGKPKGGKYYFDLYKNLKTSKEWDIIERVINSDDGIKYLENEYVKIEYHNVIGLEKAKMLISIFEQNPVFYKYFLQKIEKIVISNNCDSTDKVFVIDNMPVDIDISNDFFIDSLLEKILPQTSKVKLLKGYILNKIRGNQLVEDDTMLSFLRGKILKDMQVNRTKYLLKYISLMDGKIVNDSYVIEQAIVELSFKYSDMVLLDNYLNDRNIKEIEDNVFWTLVKDYNVLLFNESLEYQEKLLNEKNDWFLSQNMLPLFNLFQEKVDVISKKYKKELQQEKIILSKEDILNLVIEYLNKIDSSTILSQEFMKNLQNEIIKIWDSTNEIEAKEMYDQYKEDFNIYEPCTFTYYDANNQFVNIVMNAPLSFTLDDVKMIVHEFIHLYINLQNTARRQTPALGEFLSIYYEMGIYDFLLEKGYKEEQLVGLSNYRVIDSFSNFCHSAPIVFWLDKYHKNKGISYEEVLKVVEVQTDNVRNSFNNSNLSEEEIEHKMEEMGYYNNLDYSVNVLLYNLNNLLLVKDESLFECYPYILASILAYECREKGIDKQYLLQLASRINEIKNPCEVLEVVGIDLEKYGFDISYREDERKGNLKL